MGASLLSSSFLFLAVLYFLQLFLHRFHFIAGCELLRSALSTFWTSTPFPGFSLCISMMGGSAELLAHSCLPSGILKHLIGHLFCPCHSVCLQPSSLFLSSSIIYSNLYGDSSYSLSTSSLSSLLSRLSACFLLSPCTHISYYCLTTNSLFLLPVAVTSN